MRLKYKSNLKIGLFYRIKPENSNDEIYYIFDDKETIESIVSTIREIGYNVIELNLDKSKDIVEDIKNLKGKVDLVFNIANNGVFDQLGTLATFLLEYYKIPYVGSSFETLMCVSDKFKTKLLLKHYGLKTSPFQLFTSYNEKLNKKLKFPLIVKPVYGGSSYGVNQDSVVYDEKDLINKIKRVILKFKQPALVEEFLYGKEYGVGIIGNKCPNVLPIISFDLNKIPGKPKIRDNEVKKIDTNYAVFITKENKNEYKKISRLALNSYKILNCKDLARVEIRERDGEFYFIEINAKPGLDPNHSDLPIMAKYCGIEYKNLIDFIIKEALKRLI